MSQRQPQHDDRRTPDLRVIPIAPATRGERLDAGARYRRVRFVLAVVLVLNLAVAAAKIAFGLATNSLAITADGFHSLLDGASNVVALAGIAVAARPPDPNHPYGHRHYETLTSLGVAALMFLTLTEIVRGAFERLSSQVTPQVTVASFAVMGVTLLVNSGVTIWERREGRRLRSPLLLADARHTLTDMIASLSVLASLVAVALGYPAADTIVALAIAAAIAWGAWSIVRDAALVLTDATTLDTNLIERVVLSVSGVRGTHNIRSREGEGLVWVDLHIQVDPEMNVERAHDIASHVAREVEAALDDPADVTVHIEPANARHLRSIRGYEPER
jgi:cation diffusion facilitator family transporter